MPTDEIRTKFIRFFQERGHLHLPSASLVVRDDPSVLLLPAGMQPFKAFYARPELAPARRIVTIQKVARARGLDDDANSVGDNTHHTFFEMLGNFAFGDLAGGGYFKKEAIAYGYEFVRDELAIPADRLWATTWSGEPGVPADEEAVEIWLSVGVPAERIRPLNRKPEGGRENFWGPTGDSGPCGPCSEIHVDVLGSCPLGAPDDECGPEHNCGRIVEIWNLVFNQYYQEPDKTLRPLAHTGIDTGSGFERVAAIMAGVPSAYETDLFQPMLAVAEANLGVRYGESPEVTRALRIVVDHARTVTFLAGDGVFPSNEERGYVARRLERRAIRQARQLGGTKPIMAALARATIERMAPHYPYLLERQAVIEQVIAQEETRFAETLAAGTEVLNAELERLERAGRAVLPGPVAFRLYDTFGFPAELTEEIAAVRGVTVDKEGFAKELQASRARSRSSAGSRFKNQERLDLPAVSVEFLGYDQLDVERARVLYLRRDGESVRAAETSDAEVWVVLDRTPFYAERGGQVGDTGQIVGPNGWMEVSTTQVPQGEVIVHVGRVVEGFLAEGDVVRAEVYEAERQNIIRHHSATHLLHAALRAQLGEHVHQTGSLVAPDRLRFDFSHGQPLTHDQRIGVERWVNESIRRNVPVETLVMPTEEAMRTGAMALFDEKYGDVARVVQMAGVSRELCGGTHVKRTGDIGTFVVVGEASIGSGIRRVEALAGRPAEAYVERQLAKLDEASRELGTTRDELPARLAQVLAELNATRRRLEAVERKTAQEGLGSVLAAAQDVAGPKASFKLIAAEIDAAAAPNMERLREAADWLRDKLGVPSVLLLASVNEGRPQLLAAVAPELTGNGLHAGKLLSALAHALGGRGGGRPELAQGGGGDPARLATALEEGRRAALAQAGID